MAGTSSEVVIGGRRRVFKNRNTNSKNNNQLIIQRSSTNEVESMDDMLIQIFLRVPVLSLLIFKLVSKRWFNLITSRFFIERRSQVPNIDPPSGLILQRRTNSLQYIFAALDPRIPTNRILSKDSLPFGTYPDKRDIEIMHSCNGLLLCFINRFMIYVYNIFTNRYKMLPQSWCMWPIACINGMKMVFDPTKSPHYKVIYVSVLKQDVLREVDGVVMDGFCQIRTYSSVTCEWSISHKQWPVRYYDGFGEAVYWNDAIYWINMHFGSIEKLDVDNINLTSIPRPVENLREEDLGFTHELFESRGSLLFARVSREPGEFLMVFEMKNEYSEWSLKYLINIYFIIHLMPKDWLCQLIDYAKPLCIKCIVLGEKEEDSFMVMELRGKVVKYYMMSKTLHEFSDLGEIHNCVCMEDCRFSCFSFVASFAGV